MSFWPKSIPDYRWPAALKSTRHAPRRWLLATAFHVAHAAGRIVHALRPNPPAVLVLRTDGIGDAILGEPLLASLGQRFAGHLFHLWAPAASCDLLRCSPHIHCRLPVPRGFKEGNLAYFDSLKWRTTLGYRLGRWRFQTAAYLVQSPEPLGNWLLRSARARRRWYNPGDIENQFHAQRQDTARVATALLLAPAGHELNRNAHIAWQWGGDIRDRLPQVHLDALTQNAAEIQLSAWRDDAQRLGASHLIGLMPGGSMKIKRYPASSWAAVAAQLWQKRRIALALLGGPADAEATEALVAAMNDVPHLRLAHPHDILATSAIIGGLDGLLSTDTGLAHLALARDVPTVILCSGGHPGRFFPWPMQRRAVTLNHPMPCQGCRCRCHLPEAGCLTQIEPGEIAAAMIDLLDGRVRTPRRIAG